MIALQTLNGGGGPDPNDCSTLASQWVNDGGYNVAAYAGVFWTYQSCQVFQAANGNDQVNIYNCYTDWASIVNYVAWNCQSEENAQGGTCQYYGNTLTSYIRVAAS